jgi:SAM-dependent methyltransferase
MRSMAEPGDTNAAIWKSQEVVKGFAARAEQRAEQLELVARLLPFQVGDAFTFLDLGAGTGAASSAILTEYPNANAILAEYSTLMMAEGDKALSRFRGRYRYVEFDMNSSDWPSTVPSSVDAVVSALSIHHLPDSRKRSIFREIFDCLTPGGWYINYDPIRAPDSTMESIWERANDRYDPQGPWKRDNRTPQELARYENHVRYMIPLEPQLDWLREAGFQNIDVFWKRLDWVIYGGSK